jgi:hypothetical protein
VSPTLSLVNFFHTPQIFLNVGVTFVHSFLWSKTIESCEAWDAALTEELNTDEKLL